MTQLSFKEVLKRWVNKGRSTIHSDMEQLHTRDTFLPKHWKNMSHDQKKQTLESHLYLNDKREGTIKGITVAGENKQRYFIPKEDTSSPTVTTE